MINVSKISLPYCNEDNLGIGYAPRRGLVFIGRRFNTCSLNLLLKAPCVEMRNPARWNVVFFAGSWTIYSRPYKREPFPGISYPNDVTELNPGRFACLWHHHAAVNKSLFHFSTFPNNIKLQKHVCFCFCFFVLNKSLDVFLPIHAESPHQSGRHTTFPLTSPAEL